VRPPDLRRFADLLADEPESNSFEMLRGLVFRCNMISFQIEIGAPSGDLGKGLVGRPVDTRDVPTADLVLCQLRA
jgi:hypothetical protein